LLARRRETLTHAEADRVLAWSIAFTLAALPAFNVLTQDIWLSVAWGRMLLQGMNPFAHAFPRELAADIPLEYDPMPMTYGPAWALICAIVTALTRGAPLASWLLIKCVLAGAWIACLWNISQLMRPFGAAARARSLAIAG